MCEITVRALQQTASSIAVSYRIAVCATYRIDALLMLREPFWCGDGHCAECLHGCCLALLATATTTIGARENQSSRIAVCVMFSAQFRDGLLCVALLMHSRSVCVVPLADGVDVAWTDVFRLVQIG